MKLANSRLVLYATLFATRFFGKFSSRLAGVPAYLLWFIPWRVPVSERGLKKQAGWLEPTQPFSLRTSVGRVSGFTAGDGPIVILLHGFGERAAALGGFIAPLTDAGFRVVGIDLPGHGDSAGQMNNPILSAAAVREVADHFGGAHALIGHSLGGHAALWAMNEGLTVKRAVLIAPNVDMRYATETFQGFFGLPPNAMAGLERKIERRYGPHIWHDLSGEHLVRNNEISGLVFHDPDDLQVPFEGSQRLVSAWTGSRLIETPDLGHGTITRDPSVIEQAVAFVSKAAVRPPREPSKSFRPYSERAITALRARNDMTERDDSALKTHSAEPAEPTDSTDANEPMEPMERAEPTEPMDSTEPLQPMHRNESSDHSDHFEVPIGPPSAFSLRPARHRSVAQASFISSRSNR